VGDPVVRYEDNAGPVTITTPKGTAHGWACLTCNRVFAGGEPAENERLARWCCATDLPCEEPGCVGRRQAKFYVCCETCYEKKQAARYAALPEAAWDGAIPLVIFNSDRYFYDEDDLLDYCADENVKVAELRLVICEPVGFPAFDVLDFLHDSLPEDHGAADFEAPTHEIDALVDAWIEKNAPKSWEEGKMRPTLTSLPKEDARG